MTGIYLKCDKCGKTLGGEEVTKKERGLGWAETDTLRKSALALGWTGGLDRNSENDLCPECSQKELSNNES